MSCKSAIFLENSGSNSVTEGGIIPVGNVVRRFGANLRQEGSGIVAEGDGYYQVVCNFTIVPTGVGVVGVDLLVNSNSVALSQEYAGTASEPVNLTLIGVVRNTCCNARSFIEVELSNGSGTVSQSSIIVTKM